VKRRLGLLLLYPLLLIGLAWTSLRYLGCVARNPDKAFRIALMIDETCNVDANGRVNETISARAAKARNAGRRWGCVLCRVLGWVQPRHCDRALANDAVK
jgi:hypothetical protein